jgi:hypothetical protein
MYTDVSKLIAWGIESGIVEARPDLALVYYPSEYDFYWFVARTLKMLESQTSYAFPEMKEVHERLANAFRIFATKQLLRRK